MPILQLVKYLLIYSWPMGAHDAATLTIQMDIEEKQGTIYLAVYDAEASFLKLEEAIVKKSVVLDENFSGQVVLENLNQGTYAIAAYCDLNNNKKLDRNLFGAPKEPYGFSKPIISKWRKPTFEEVMFTIEATDASLAIRLAYWADW